MRKHLIILVALCGLVLGLAQTAMAGNSRVVANITTRDVNKVAMAINFTHTIMKKKGYEATLFFNVYGVALVDKRKPSPIYPTGESIAKMLDAFLADGGTIVACPMCMKNVGGMSNEDLLPGVQAKPGMGLEAITRPDTLVLSY